MKRATVIFSMNGERSVAVFTILWSLALPAFGVRQASMLIGPSHWIIRLTHLFMGLIAIGLGQRLATHILRRADAGR